MCALKLVGHTLFLYMRHDRSSNYYSKVTLTLLIAATSIISTPPTLCCNFDAVLDLNEKYTGENSLSEIKIIDKHINELIFELLIYLNYISLDKKVTEKGKFLSDGIASNLFMVE